MSELEDMELELDVTIEQKKRALESASYWMNKYEELKKEFDNARVIAAYTFLEDEESKVPQWEYVGLVRAVPIKGHEKL